MLWDTVLDDDMLRYNCLVGPCCNFWGRADWANNDYLAIPSLQARRHTTEVRLADLPTSEDTEKEFEQPSALHYSDAESSSLKGVASEGELKSSWDSLDAEATGIHYEGSQVEEMSLRSVIMLKHGFQLS